MSDIVEAILLGLVFVAVSVSVGMFFAVRFARRLFNKAAATAESLILPHSPGGRVMSEDSSTPAVKE